jgi:hypothetical protein
MIKSNEKIRKYKNETVVKAVALCQPHEKAKSRGRALSKIY